MNYTALAFLAFYLDNKLSSIFHQIFGHTGPVNSKPWCMDHADWRYWVMHVIGMFLDVTVVVSLVKAL